MILTGCVGSAVGVGVGMVAVAVALAIAPLVAIALALKVAVEVASAWTIFVPELELLDGFAEVFPDEGVINVVEELSREPQLINDTTNTMRPASVASQNNGDVRIFM